MTTTRKQLSSFTRRRYARRFVSLVLLLFVSLTLAPIAGRAGEPAEDHSAAVQQAVRKAVPYLWTEGEGWINQRGCVSCHQVPIMLWGLSAAEQSGIDVGSDRLQKWKQWAVTPEAFVRPEQRETLDVDKTLASNIDTMNMLLAAVGNQDSLGSDWKSTFTAALIDNQNEDGSWKACGQLPMQKRPATETTQVTVMWTLLGLLHQGESPRNLQAAVAMTENESPESTEYLATRLLLADQLDGLDPDPIRRELIQHQQDDGGWGWLSSDPSDALATGMALYALRSTTDRQSLRSVTIDADQFLIQTQKDDGSWDVPGTKKKTKDETTPTSNYWGTGWAVVGLLQ